MGFLKKIMLNNRNKMRIIYGNKIIGKNRNPICWWISAPANFKVINFNMKVRRSISKVNNIKVIRHRHLVYAPSFCWDISYTIMVHLGQTDVNFSWSLPRFTLVYIGRTIWYILINFINFFIKNVDFFCIEVNFFCIEVNCFAAWYPLM